MSNIQDRVNLFWQNPLSPTQDALQLALLVGFIMGLMLLWKNVMSHILED